MPTLHDLIHDVPGAALLSGSLDTPITAITHDTRQVIPGALFVAIPGFRVDGAALIPQALAAGAAAVATEGSTAPCSAAVVRVPSGRTALAELSAAFYGHPSRHIPVIGVTGTDGKTSTTQLLASILEIGGLATGWMTTVNTRTGGEVRPNAVDHTTPEANVVQQTLARMVKSGDRVAVLETSSHALALERVHRVCYQVGVFTNLSEEHLNFHGSFEEYRAAKARLFESLPEDGLAVLNADDPSFAFMRRATRAHVVTYGFLAGADFHATNVALGPSGTQFVLDHAPGLTRPMPLATRLVGGFNVLNWLAAFAAARHFGATLEHFTAALEKQAPIPGRVELVDAGQPFAVLVDFAHTPQALENVLRTARSLGHGRVLLTFGLAGGRDPHNRPRMGALASTLADYFVISTDDPGDEDPAVIAAEVARGVRSGAEFDVELDRRAAIDMLVRRARTGDVVVLAGKGHETRMVLRDRRSPWSDREEARAALRRLGYGGR